MVGRLLNNFLHPGTNADDVRKSLALLACRGILEALQVRKGLHPSQHPVARLFDLCGAHQDQFLLTGLGADFHLLVQQGLAGAHGDAHGAFLMAQITPEDVPAELAQGFVPGIPGDFLGGAVKITDLPPGVHQKHPLRELVHDLFVAQSQELEGLPQGFVTPFFQGNDRTRDPILFAEKGDAAVKNTGSR